MLASLILTCNCMENLKTLRNSTCLSFQTRGKCTSLSTVKESTRSTESLTVVKAWLKGSSKGNKKETKLFTVPNGQFQRILGTHKKVPITKYLCQGWFRIISTQWMRGKLSALTLKETMTSSTTSYQNSRRVTNVAWGDNTQLYRKRKFWRHKNKNKSSKPFSAILRQGQKGF